ncbi:MAG TPA: four helix bundle protein [Candidatus Didemnitutus sp.]|nr:four helix bundle protein [Candidatus Didemnitutus sp.]
MVENRIATWRDLLVWKKAHAGVVAVYELAREFPGEERYRLTDQLCRAAASIPTNIAEGKGRGSLAEYRHFLIIARGSIEETRYLLYLAKDLGLISPAKYEQHEATYTEISKMTNALIRSLKP